MKKSSIAYPYILYMLIFILAPVVIIIATAFYDNGSFSFANIMRVFEPMYLSVLARSFWTAVICTIACLVIGYPVAMTLATSTFKYKNALLFLIVAPMWMNFLLRTYAWMAILERNGVLNRTLEWMGLPRFDLLFTQSAVILGLVYAFLPFMILPIYTSISKMDKSIIEAAKDLGAGRVSTFTRVIFPLSLPGVISGITMVFMPSITTFVVTRLLGGGQNMLIGDMIEYQFSLGGNRAFGAALSFVLILLILLTMSFARRYEEQSLEGGGLY